MATLQKRIEDIVKDNIELMSGQRQQRRSLHIGHINLDLLDSLYGEDEDCIAFINHFGHIEYQNRSFQKMVMADRNAQAFNNMFNLDQLPADFDLNNDRLTVTYPMGTVMYMDFSHQLVPFQKVTLLKLTFKDCSEVYSLREEQTHYKQVTDCFMSHITTPMFITDMEGMICHVPNSPMKLFGKPLNQLKDESIFEALPYDFARQLKEKLQNITQKISGHFMYQTEHDRIVKMYDITVALLEENQYLCQLTDVSDLNTMSSTIEYLNSYDSLTGFYNTNYYDNTLSSFTDSSHLPLGIYVLNLHGLKQANIRLGHHQTNNLIIEITLNIKSLLSQHEIPCRISGDTFVVFFPNCSRELLDKFSQRMETFIKTYQHTYSDHYITYSEKNILINNSDQDLRSLIDGMTV